MFLLIFIDYFYRRAGLAGAILLLAAASLCAQDLTPPYSLTIQAAPGTLSGGESGTLRVKAFRDAQLPAKPIAFKLRSDDPLLVFKSVDVTIPETQSGVDIEFGTGSTPVAKTVRVRAADGEGRTAETFVNIVPALLSRASCTPSTLYGTKGNAVTCTAELKAPAPVGGILIYVSPPAFTPSTGVKKATFQLTNPAIPAGGRTGSVQIQYDALINVYSALSFSSAAFSTTFESQNRQINLVLALESQGGKLVWDPIPNRAIRTGFELVPLRPASFSVQPSAISPTAEGTATFVLNSAPGNSESVTIRTSNSDAARVVAANGVCAAATTSALELQLVPGSTTQTFKVCARPVTAPTNVELTMFMRSGDHRAPVTVNP